MAVLVPVFISFDYDHDEDLRVMLLGQAKNAGSPFSIADWSVKEAMTGNWKEKVKTRIRRTKVMAVICGHYTHTAAGVNAEICCHTMRATGITAYLNNGGTLEKAQQMAAHASSKTTSLYDRTSDAVDLNEVERVQI